MKKITIITSLIWVGIIVVTSIAAKELIKTNKKPAVKTINWVPSGFVIINNTKSPIIMHLRGGIEKVSGIIQAGQTGVVECSAVWHAVEVNMIINDIKEEIYVTGGSNTKYKGIEAFKGVGYMGNYLKDKMLVGDRQQMDLAEHISDLDVLNAKLQNSISATLEGQYAGIGGFTMKEKPTYEITGGLEFDGYQLISRKLKIRKTNTVGNGMMAASPTQNF